MDNAAKRKFIVTIEETVSQAFDIEAEDDGETMEIAEKMYKSGEPVRCGLPSRLCAGE
jgi:hypothetical protein